LIAIQSSFVYVEKDYTWSSRSPFIKRA